MEIERWDTINQESKSTPYGGIQQAAGYMGQGLGGKSWREFHSWFLKICKLALKPHDLVKSEDGWLPVKSDRCFQCRPICLLIGIIGNWVSDSHSSELPFWSTPLQGSSACIWIFQNGPSMPSWILKKTCSLFFKFPFIATPQSSYGPPSRIWKVSMLFLTSLARKSQC